MTLELTCISKCIKCRKEYELRYCNNRLCLDCKVLSKKETNDRNNKRNSLMRKSIMISCRFCDKLTSGYNGKHYCSSSCRTKYYNIPKNILYIEEQITKLSVKLARYKYISEAKGAIK